MTRAERYSITFILLLNVFICGLVILVLGNASTVEDLTYIATSDAAFLFIAAIAGLVSNIMLAWLLFRLLNRSIRQQRSRPRITGE